MRLIQFDRVAVNAKPCSSEFQIEALSQIRNYYYDAKIENSRIQSTRLFWVNILEMSKYYLFDINCSKYSWQLIISADIIRICLNNLLLDQSLYDSVVALYEYQRSPDQLSSSRALMIWGFPLPVRSFHFGAHVVKQTMWCGIYLALAAHSMVLSRPAKPQLWNELKWKKRTKSATPQIRLSQWMTLVTLTER